MEVLTMLKWHPKLVSLVIVAASAASVLGLLRTARIGWTW
jgi:hypothetical protein